MEAQAGSGNIMFPHLDIAARHAEVAVHGEVPSHWRTESLGIHRGPAEAEGKDENQPNGTARHGGVLR
jgi:hypothetical protein